MGMIELVLIAVSLSMDAFAVSICKGLSLQNVNGKHMVIAGAWFGGFQALMPLIGYGLGSLMAGFIQNYTHWIAFILLAWIGGNMIKDSFGEEEGVDGSMTWKSMLVLAIATSIDALVAGVSIYLSSAQCGTDPTLHAVLLPAAAIGFTTFLCTAAGFFLTRRLHRFPTFHLEAGAGLILIGLGVKMLCDHLC